MATLLSLTNQPTSGSKKTFSTANSVRIIQLNPSSQGFSGTVVIEGSLQQNPTGWSTLASINFSQHRRPLVLEIQTNVPSVRARVTAATGGSIGVTASEDNRNIQGSTKSGTATAIVSSGYRVKGLGENFQISSRAVASISSDDVSYASNNALSLTDVLDGTNGAIGKQDKIGTITASAEDLNLLAGAASVGVLPAHFTALSSLDVLDGLTATGDDINAIAGLGGTGVTSTQIGHLQGLTENVQNAIGRIPELSGLTASASDLNILSGIFNRTGRYSGSNNVTISDIVRLSGLRGNIQNQLDGKRNADEKISLLDISGLADGMTVNELNYLDGVTAGVQAQFNDANARIDAFNTSLSGKIDKTGGAFTEKVLFAGGTPDDPSISFSANTRTGIYLDTDNTIGFSAGRTSVVSINSNGLQVGRQGSNPVIKANVNSVTAPAYSFSGSESTGVYEVANGVLGLSASGQEVARFSSATNDGVSIGGNEASNIPVKIAGVFEGEKLLSKTRISSWGVGDQTLHTTPAGRTTIVTKIIAMIVAGEKTSDDGLRMNIGYTPVGNHGDFINDTNGTWNDANFIDSLSLLIFDRNSTEQTSAFPSKKAIAGNVEVKADITAASLSSDLVMDILIFGIEIS